MIGADLRPCPFCGDVAKLHQDLDADWSVLCVNDECKGAVGPFHLDVEARLAWQLRPAIPHTPTRG